MAVRSFDPEPVRRWGEVKGTPVKRAPSLPGASPTSTTGADHCRARYPVSASSRAVATPGASPHATESASL